MSDVPIGREGRKGGADTFRTRTVALIVIIGILGFAGMLILAAFSPDLRSGRNGGAHALSNAATGFNGIVRLAKATGRNPIVVRNVHQLGTRDLLITTPDHGTQELSPVLKGRDNKPTLLVFPKWDVSLDRSHSGWVHVDALLPVNDPGRMLAPNVVFRLVRKRTSGRDLLFPTNGFDRTIRPAAPRVLQVITGQTPRRGEGLALIPLLTDRAGDIVLARYGSGPLYLLADPDLMSNAGITNLRQVEQTLAMLDWMNATNASSIAFDVTTNGFGRSSSPLKLAFTPPFLAATLALVAVLLLAGWHAVGRFGPIRPRTRATGFGKAVLVDNSAKLIRRAGRERQLGNRYVQVMRERAVAIFKIPARLKDAALDAHLDKMSAGRGQPFSELARAASGAADRVALIEAAQALYKWQKERQR
ncbi:hypothetical protein ACSBM8_14805 [Sphingomonas sp. ASY06-1R]|uniref:hypothetical protein n=1 Tax=Sphingomonas sp. ASY06-1R TaxID=3445771 RepID=UPI003FA1D03A